MDSNQETMWAIRRVDGEPMFGEYSYATVDGPDDWGLADEDADQGDGTAEYELVEMQVTVVGRRKLPECAERCGQPAEFWGLCEEHAREDDPETLAEMVAAREV